MTAADRKPARVLVVDDESIIASTLAMILNRHGFEASFFTASNDALIAAKNQPPDLLLSDVVMPHLSGIDLAIQVQYYCPNCKVLLLSGQALTADLLQNARANGHEFEVLAKPVHPIDLLKRVESIITGGPRMAIV